MGELFGTDGIRGVAYEYPMTADLARRVGQASAEYFKDKSKIVVGKDTRLSGDSIASAIVSGMCAMGTDAINVGTMPTPGIAYLATHLKADAGIVISASHNPYYDNGIKLFKNNGYKLSDEDELALEQLILNNQELRSTHNRNTGKEIYLDEAPRQYISFLQSRIPSEFSLKGLKVAMDCSNGATYQVGPELFTGLGADIYPICISPDGKNINDGCGSQHLDLLIKKVLQARADIGIAFDGDGDRLVAVDEKGYKVTGDKILLICGKYLKSKGKLRNNRIVSTVMSNFGLGVALKKMDIEHIIADVGDRYVLEEMNNSGAVLGGEDSGHLIFLADHTTGDGLLAALKLIEAMRSMDKPLSELNTLMSVYPQVLLNVTVSEKPDIATIPAISEAIKDIENRLGEKGRVLVRYSGTQPLCRVMVEGQDAGETEQYCKELSQIIKDTIG